MKYTEILISAILISSILLIGKSIYQDGFADGYTYGIQENIDRELTKLGIFEISDCVGPQ